MKNEMPGNYSVSRRLEIDIMITMKRRKTHTLKGLNNFAHGVSFDGK